MTFGNVSASRCFAPWIALPILVLASAVLHAAPAQESASYAGTEPAAEFPAGLDWLNTGGEALTLQRLRGKVVLLDFWTYGCINCMHIIPDLERLEASYADELVVIGVHSAKFGNESDTQNIRRIVQRYGLEHPVVNDKDFRIWKAYGASAWPTLVLIDPDGKLVGSVAGEGHYTLLDKVIGKLIAEFDREQRIDRAPLGFEPERAASDSPLLFPGKVLADAAGGRLFIADSNHHRIVITSLEGAIRGVIGSGDAGLRDGTFQQAAFRQPQGLTLAGENTLYVADTANHALRRVDLHTHSVSTVAGNGEQGYLSQGEADAEGTPLSSPWDVLFVDGLVYVAMAGQHQIWTYDPQTGKLREFAGSRREELRDGPRLEAGLNQPSGLATDGRYLYVADSEASAIRRIGLGPRGKVDTIVGVGLFEFGDKDGYGDEVRLQHPLGIAFSDGALFVADTYNGKIKRIDPNRRRSRAVVGREAELSEPGGISIGADRLYIADTNHHRIRVAPVRGGDTLTLELTGAGSAR